MAELTKQQEMLLEQKYINLQSVSAAGDHLDGKAMGLLQTAGLIIALTAVVSVPSAFRATTMGIGPVIGISIAFLAFVAMISFATWAWWPRSYGTPGTLDFDEISERIINQDVDQSFSNILGDCIDAIEWNQDINLRKARLVRWSAFLLIAQVIGLFMAAISSTDVHF